MNDEYDEDIEEELRTSEDVAKRCCVLMAIVATGHTQPLDATVNWLMDESLWDSVSPNEREFLMDPTPALQDVVDATWRAEALHALLWSLGKIDQLCPPTEQCSLSAECEAVPYLRPTANFIGTARLIDGDTIQETLGEVLHAHWEVRDAQLFGKPLPSGYISGAIYERHYALNWLTGYCGQEWDDISTDT